MLFRFELPAGKSLALPTGQHLSIRGKDSEGNPISRQYTPVTNENTVGYFDVVIKIYPDGQLGNYLKNLPVNSNVDIRGPFGAFHYQCNGQVEIRRAGGAKKYNVSNIGMIAGGSGLTPMYQIAQNISDAKESTKMTLLFGNQTEGDIIYRDHLDALAQRNPNFKVWYAVDRPYNPETWKYTKGYLTAEVFKEQLPPPGPNTLILLCGPPGLIKASTANLTSIGYTEDMLFSF